MPPDSHKPAEQRSQLPDSGIRLMHKERKRSRSPDGEHRGGPDVMKFKTILTATGRTLKIWACDNLDIQLHSAFANAAVVANYALIDDIEIDLKNTRTVRDSGLALLLMLFRRSGLRDGHIRLVNCPKDLKTRLSRNNMAGHFRIV
jgi:ABC-type transporter Mla MlaB component